MRSSWTPRTRCEAFSSLTVASTNASRREALAAQVAQMDKGALANELAIGPLSMRIAAAQVAFDSPEKITQEQVAETMGISLRAAERHWTWAKAWLFQRIRAQNPADPPS